MQILSLSLFALAGLLSVAFGIRYLTTRAFMPYHAQVLGQPWETLPPKLQSIILGLLRVAGAGLLGCGCALWWLLLPMSRGEAWAALSTFFLTTAPILYVVLWLRRISPGARTPVAPTVAAIVLVLMGGLAFWAAQR